jgi:hypothetical protein
MSGVDSDGSVNVETKLETNLADISVTLSRQVKPSDQSSAVRNARWTSGKTAWSIGPDNIRSEKDSRIFR